MSSVTTGRDNWRQHFEGWPSDRLELDKNFIDREIYTETDHKTRSFNNPFHKSIICQDCGKYIDIDNEDRRENYLRRVSNEGVDIQRIRNLLIDRLILEHFIEADCDRNV